MRFTWLGCLAFLPGIQACAALPEISAGECGNGVIEEGEDCDTFAPNEASRCRNKGAPDECRLDCSRLGNGIRRPCPSDWGCNLDQICRPASGGFEQRVDVTLGSGGALMSADFDGDGHADIVSLEPADTLGRTRLRFHYFDDRGSLQESVAFPKLLLSPVLSDLSGDGHSDVVFSDGRIGLLLGGDRSWVPETFGSYRIPNARVRMIGVYDHLINRGTAVVALTTLAGQPSGFYVPNADDLLELVGELPGAPDALIGDPATGNIVENTTRSPCVESVLALAGAEAFYLVDFCTRSAQGEVTWRSQVDARTIALSPPAPIDSPPQVVDMDGDGHLDVLVGAGGHPYVAFGDGEGLGTAARYRVKLANPNETNPDIPTPLAVGDFTGDGAVDFVFPDHLLVSLPTLNSAVPTYLPDRLNVGGSWSEAKVADLNGNGKLDVVAASNQRPNIDFFNGSGSEHPTMFSVATAGPVRQLTIGDFDGDLLQDLAFVEASASSQRPDALMVAFGNLSGSPTPAAPIARIDGVEQLSVYHQAGLANLMVASSERTGQLRTGVLTLLEGSGDRALIAPYALTRFSSNGTLQQSTALSLAAGAFTAPGEHDVLTLASPDPAAGPWEFWLLPNLYSSASLPLRLEGRLDDDLVPARASGEYGLSVNLGSGVADLDGDGRAEAVFAMPSEDQGCGLVFAGTQDDDSVALLTVRVDEPCQNPQLAAFDIDADGAVDIALLTGAPGRVSGKLLVLWNDGHGAFSSERVSRISAEGDSPLQFTLLPATPQRALSFAYVTDSAARLVTESSLARSFDAPSTLDRLEHGTGIVAADVNGDGVMDLALTDSGTLSILLAELKAP